MPRALTLAFLLLAVPTAIALALLTPAGQVADEPAHVLRAEALRQGQTIGTRDTGRSGVRADPALHAVTTLIPGVSSAPLPFTPAHAAAAQTIAWSGAPLFFEIGSIALYMPALYAPGAIGLAGAQAAGLGPYDAVIAGRLAGALAFALLGALTLQIARQGRTLTFCALACPMTVSLAGSMNPDALLIATALLATACAGAERTSSATALIAALGMIKLPFAALAVLILPGRGGLLRAAVAILPGLAWTAWMAATLAAPNARPPYTPGPLWPGDPTQVFTSTDMEAQLQVLLANPARVLTLPADTLFRSPGLLRQAIGVLGWLNIVLPLWLTAAWLIALPAAAFADLRTGLRRPIEAILPLLGLAGAALAITLSQYLTWTPVGAARIEGVQGRYFLPLTALLARLLPRAPLPAWTEKALPALPILAAAIGAAALPLLIRRIYGGG